MNITVINEMHTQNVMILDKQENGNKRFHPQTLINLINYADSADWVMDSNMIDLQLLTYDEKTELTRKLDFEKEIITVPANFQINTDAVEWELYSIKLTYNSDELIFLPGHYEVIKVDSNSGSHKYVKVSEVQAQDQILCNFFNNVIISQSVFEINQTGKYSIQDTIEFNIEGEYFMPIGNHVFQIYCK